MDEPNTSIVAELYYQDPRAALAWLSKAFGFETRMIVADAEAKVLFAETGWGEYTVAIIPEVPRASLSPNSVGGTNTQSVRFRSDRDIAAHCEIARQEGANIIQEPDQFFFGDRTYVAVDLEGHHWTFAQQVSGAGGPPPEGITITYPSKGENLRR